jgi:hypothetical protein
MLDTTISVALWAVCVCAGLYLLWEIKEGVGCLMTRRRAKRMYKARSDSICKWGFNSEGELVHIRCKRGAPD